MTGAPPGLPHHSSMAYGASARRSGVSWASGPLAETHSGQTRSAWSGALKPRFSSPT